MHSHPGVPFAQAAEQVAAAARTAISAAGGKYQATLVRHVCVPGCVLFLGHIVSKADQQQEAALLLGDESAAGSASAATGGGAAYSDGVWQLECRVCGVRHPASSKSSSSDVGSSAGASSSGDESRFSSLKPRQLLVDYDDIQSMNDDAEGGVLGATLQSAFAQAVMATTQPAPAAPAAGGHAASLTPQCIVAAWGEEVQLQLFASEGHSSGSFISASYDDLGSSSSSGPVVRVAVAQGSCIISDEQVQLQSVGASGSGIGLRLSLDSIGSSISCRRSGDGVAVLSLFILPSDGNASSSMGRCIGAWAPLARATMLLLPTQAAAEVQGWLQQQRLSQQQVAPLLLDLALLLGSSYPLQHVSAEWASSPAPDAAPAPAGSLAEDSEESSPGGIVGLGLMALLGQGMIPYLQAYGWEVCAGLAATRMRELFEAVQREGPAQVQERAGLDHGEGAAGAGKGEGGRDACSGVPSNSVLGGDARVRGAETVGAAAGIASGVSLDEGVGCREMDGGSGNCEVAAMAAAPGLKAEAPSGLGSVIAAVEQRVREGDINTVEFEAVLDKGASCSSSVSFHGSSSQNSNSSSCKSKPYNKASTSAAALGAGPVVLAHADAAAAAGWGPSAWLLCCRGFKGGAESSFLVFKARWFELSDRVLLTIQLLSAMVFWCKCYSGLPGWTWSPSFMISAGKPMIEECKQCTHYLSNF